MNTEPVLEQAIAFTQTADFQRYSADYQEGYLDAISSLPKNFMACVPSTWEYLRGMVDSDPALQTNESYRQGFHEALDDIAEDMGTPILRLRGHKDALEQP